MQRFDGFFSRTKYKLIKIGIFNMQRFDRFFRRTGIPRFTLLMWGLKKKTVEEKTA